MNTSARAPATNCPYADEAPRRSALEAAADVLSHDEIALSVRTDLDQMMTARCAREDRPVRHLEPEVGSASAHMLHRLWLLIAAGWSCVAPADMADGRQPRPAPHDLETARALARLATLRYVRLTTEPPTIILDGRRYLRGSRMP